MPAGLQANLELSQLQRQSVVTAWHRYLSRVDDARRRSRRALGVLRGQAGLASQQEDPFLPGNAGACLEDTGAEVLEVGSRPDGWQAGMQALQSCLCALCLGKIIHGSGHAHGGVNPIQNHPHVQHPP